MKFSRRTILLSASAIVVAAVICGAALAVINPGTKTPSPSPSPSASASAQRPSATADPYTAPTAAEVAALPETKYNAVTPGLLGYVHDGVPAAATAVYSIATDAPLYGADKKTPVARFAAKNFLAQNSVIVPVEFDGPWALVLTPSRQALPSKHPGAPAQSSGWLRRSLLTKVQDLRSHIVVSVKAQTVSIVDAAGKITKTFGAGVGANNTPTPTGVVGYMQARYLDPAQDQRVYPIGLTSLHSSAADEPFGGKDGGLIGIHYQPAHSGAISHGCVRLDGAAITALDQLPLGTPVVMDK